MRCPKCAYEDTKVLESRSCFEGRSIRRRRMCIKCGYRFTTYEKEEELILQVHKKDNSYEPYCRQKIINSFLTACKKRPISVDQIENAVIRIESMLRDEGEKIISSQKIGDMAMNELKKLDRVAYVRFASIYKDFKDPSAFKTELEALSDENDNRI